MVINKVLDIKIPFLAFFCNLSVVPMALNNYTKNQKMASLKCHRDLIL